MNLAKYIDHTYLKPIGTSKEIEKLCEEAKEYEFVAVCVNPVWIDTCKKLLKGTSVKVATVIGFPLGAMTTDSKVFETKNAIELGADEIDMVMNIGKMLEEDYDYVNEDISKIASTCGNKVLKVIIETAYLSKDEIVKACKLAVEAGADYVKTSTGFASEGATLENVMLMRETVGENIGVKAAGGIRNYSDAIKMIEAGATRLGASSGVKIASGANE
ncbi:MAG: deoxyribose-phosphate aldolase [Clostridia bacterium]